MAIRQTHIGPVEGVTRQSPVIFTLFILLNLALKLPFLTSSPIALDEPFSIFHSQQSLAELFELFPKENNPPLHYLVLHFVIQLFGIGAWSVRLPSLIFSCLAAGFLFRSGERHFGRMAGMAAAAMFTVCNFHIYHAHEARTYSLLVFLTVLALDRFLRLASEPDKTSNYVWLGIWNALLIYSHFLGFWIILAQGAAFFLLRNKGKLWWRLGLSWAGTGLLYLPYLFVLLARVGNYSSVGTWMWEPHWTELYGNVNRFLNGRLGTVALGVVLLLWLGTWLLSESRKMEFPAWARVRKIWVAGLFFGLIYFGMFAISFVVSPVFLDRYLLFTTVPLFLLLGKLCDGIFVRQRLKWGAVGILVAGMAVNLDLNPSNERPVDALVRQITVLQSEETPLIVCPPYRDLAILYHRDRDAFADYKNKSRRLQELNIYPLQAAAEIPERFASQSSVLYLDADSEFTHPGNGIRQKLQSLFSTEVRTDFGPVYHLYQYRKQ